MENGFYFLLNQLLAENWCHNAPNMCGIPGPTGARTERHLTAWFAGLITAGTFFTARFRNDQLYWACAVP
jgi:hypothetical protein